MNNVRFWLFVQCNCWLQVTALAAQRSKIGKTIVVAGAKSVSRVNAILKKTSKAVKVIYG